MTIVKYLGSKGIRPVEGYSQQIPEQIRDLIELTKNSLNVMEIGFNAGHSAELFLENNKNVKVVSFDLGEHDYVKDGKQYIDLMFPNRHTLILGDSRETVPQFIRNNPGVTFDVIFIDGGHTYEIARADLENCYYLSNKETIVILDDTIFKSGWEQFWTLGPTRTWMEHLSQKRITELNRKSYTVGRGMCWGKYTL